MFIHFLFDFVDHLYIEFFGILFTHYYYSPLL
jgi:hypothetical protein